MTRMGPPSRSVGRRRRALTLDGKFALALAARCMLAKDARNHPSGLGCGFCLV